jgi:glycine/serine hydroxymethyltransferase
MSGSDRQKEDDRVVDLLPVFPVLDRPDLAPDRLRWSVPASSLQLFLTDSIPLGLATQAKVFKPRLLICGASAYPRDWDYARLRAIADEHGAFLMADIAHTSGLVAAGELADPFAHCDVVTTTTHKTLRGPRAGLIFFRKDAPLAQDLEKRVNEAVFPACQGGPHNNVRRAAAPLASVLTA